MDGEQMPESMAQPKIEGFESPPDPSKETACAPKATTGPGKTLRKPGFGPLIIAKREFLSNLKSVRMLVMVLLFVLAVLGGTYGFTSLSTGSEKAGVETLAWSIVDDMDGSGALDDFHVTISDQKAAPLAGLDVEVFGYRADGRSVSLMNVTTDAAGQFVVRDASIFPYGEYTTIYYKFDYDGKERVKVPSSGSRITAFGAPFFLMAQATDLDGDNINDDVVVVCKDASGAAISGVSINLSADDFDTLMGVTDAEGIFTAENLEAGGMDMEGGGFGQISKAYTVDALNNSVASQATFVVAEDDSSISRMFDIQNPDQILSLIAMLFITMLAPIIGIVLAYDSISKERLQNSLDFLLCRPTPKSSVILGKFAGLMAAIGLPVTLVNLGAVGIISNMTGEAPSATLVAGFIVATLMLMAIFILLQMVFSTLVTSTGTAILSGIGIWLLFVLFWDLMGLALNIGMGNALNSDSYYILSNQLNLGNPVGAYQLAIGSLTADSPNSVAGVPDWSIWASMAAWLATLFVFAPWLFAKRSSKL